MADRPDGTPGRRARILYYIVILAVVATILVAILAYRQAPSAPQRGSGALPSQAAEGSGAAPR